MNKEMKKNKKMVLALVIVAALAMVSVAAIAIHSDDSSAAAGSGMYVPMGSSNSFAIDATITTDCEFYVNVGDNGKLDFEITSNANYTGTLTIGTLDKTVSPWVYTPYASLKLTNVSNVNMTAEITTAKGVTGADFVLCNTSTDAQVNSDGVYELTDGAPSGTFELLQGSAVLGADADNFFNGAVTAAGFTATSEFAFGTVVGISADGTAQISGNVKVGDMADPDPLPTGWVAADLPTPTLTLSGVASIQFPDATQKLNDANGGGVAYNDVLITTGIEVTIADGAVITAGDRAPSLATSVSIDGTDIVWGYLLDLTNGVSNKGTVNGAADSITFDDVAIGTYTLAMLANTDYAYYATVTVTATGISLGSNTLPTTMAPNDLFDSPAAGELTYDSGAYTFKSITNISSAETGTATADNTGVGSITFPSVFKETTDIIVAVMVNQTTGIQELFCGVVGTNSADKLLTATTANTPTADQIKGSAITVDSAITTFKVAGADDTVHIFGTLNLLYLGDNQYGVFNIMAQANVDLNADGGMITQGVKPNADGTLTETPITMIFGSHNLKTAYYWTNDTTGTPVVSTYYLTSLANAIKNSNQVTLYGKIVILEDLTLTSPNSDPLKVIIGPQASLEVGKVDNGVDDPAVSAILTIPDGTTLINPTGQHYEVVNGQAVYVNKPTPSSNEPICDVLISGNNKYIYTDVATALDISSGNVSIDTLRWATLIRNATVQSGVTLNLNSPNGLTIPDKMILTVNGTIEDKAGMTIVGTLMINNVVNSSKNITLGGSIVITKDGTLNLNGSTLTGDDKSVLVVDGTLNMTGAATGTVTTVTIEGKATITTLKVEGVLRIGAVPSLSTGYTNSASITGKLSLDGAKAIAWVYGSFDAESVFTNTLISTAYMIDATTYLTIYVDEGQADLVAIPMVYGDEFDGAGYMLDIAISDWNNNRMLRGDFLSDNIGKVFIGGDSWTIVYAEWSAKQYKVTFNYMPGVTWTCNGQTIDSNNNFVMIDYGASISVQVFVQPGYEGTPVIQKDNTAVSGNPYTTTVTGNVTFSVKDGSVQVAGTGTTDNNSSSGLSLIEILLIIIVIIIAIMAIIIAIRLLRS